MIHLTYSNRTEELLAGFVGRAAAERERRGPYAPLRLVVPNRNVETYVKFGLAEALGIAANIEVSFLRRLLAELTTQLVPDGRLVDAAEMEGHLLALLHDPAFLAGAELGPVGDYLAAAAGSADALDRRRCQLAAELATLFDEYAASRPEMLRAWRERLTLADHPNLAGAERWQRALWLALFGQTSPQEGRVAAHAAGAGYTAVTLAELVKALERLPEEAGQALAPLHVFGVSYIARGFHAVLAALARHTDVHLYTLNPCREFWEDLETTAESRRRRKRSKEVEALFPPRARASQPGLALGDDPFALLDERENLALRLWGRPGRENIRVLNQQGGGDFDGRFVSASERGKATLLARLQDDILDRVIAPAPEAAATADDSLRVLPCPGVRRELEVVAAEIWKLLEDDPGLRLNQIAVVVPEAVKDSYLSHVAAVFGEAHQLPHSIVDLPLSASHRLGDAAVALLNVPLVAATRRELLPVLTHPALMGRFPDASPADWLRLAEDLGIVHGADRQDHEGTYIERDVLNWDQGIRRVVLGSLMEAGAQASEADETPVTLGGQQYLPLGRTGDEQPPALAFALLARSLLADARFLSGVTGPRLRPLAEWAELIRALLTGYLVPAGDHEEASLARCLSEVDALDQLPLGDTPVSYRVAATLVERALGRLGGATGQYLAHGVTVTSFVPMRAIPFRVVFVVGLGQSQFPRNGRGGELDLRAARRQLGDVSPREQDLYMFLETLLSTRDRLILSYVARDELTGASLAPSSVLLELRDLLATGYLPPAEVHRLFAPDDRPPLRRYDDLARLRPGTLAHREAGAKRLGRSLREALPEGAAVPDLPALRRTLDPDRYEPLARRLAVNGPPAAAGKSVLAGLAPGERLVVPLSAVRQFLEDPLQGSARFRLRLREVEGDEELLDREQEAFVTERPLRAGLLREIMQRVVAGGEPTPEALEAMLAAVARREELRGSAPTGYFAAAERPALVRVLQGWHQQLQKWGGGQPLAGRLLRFGRPGVRERLPGERRDPIRLTIPGADLGLPSGRDLEVELTGGTDVMVGPPDAATSVLFHSRSFIGDAARQHRDRLRAFVDHLALTAAGEREAAHGSLIVWAVPGESSLIHTRFRPLPAAEARRYLAEMVADMVTGARDSAGQPTGVHPYLLPCEAVFNSRTRKGAGSLGEEIEKLRDAYLELPFKTFSSVTGPVPEAVERHDPPGDAEAARLAARRFDLYFDLYEEKPT